MRATMRARDLLGAIPATGVILWLVFDTADTQSARAWLDRWAPQFGARQGST